MEGIIGHHQAQPRRCTVSTLSLGKWLVEWRHLCFSSVAFGGSLVELIRRFKLAGPNPPHTHGLGSMFLFVLVYV